MLTMKLSVFCTESAARNDRRGEVAVVAGRCCEIARDGGPGCFRGGSWTNSALGPSVAVEVVLCGLFGIGTRAAIPGGLNVAQV
jgi:hypothetical protein